jgi:hypothetical protein
VRSLNGVGRLFEANKSEFFRSWFLTCQNSNEVTCQTL